MLRFAQTVVGGGSLIDEDEFHDIVHHETDLSPLSKTRIVMRAAEKELGVAAMRRLHDAFVADNLDAEFKLYAGAVHGFVVFGDAIGGEAAAQANRDIFNDILKARRDCRGEI